MVRTPVATVESRLGQGNYRRIAAVSGLTPQHVGRVLRGIRGASFHVAARIADAADVSLDELHRYIVGQPGLRIRGRRTTQDYQRGTDGQAAA